MISLMFYTKIINTRKTLHIEIMGMNMPFPRNWVEELIYEWLTLKGYLTLSNIRLKSGRGGGAQEADIIGVKSKKEGKEKIVLEIVHVEAGNLSSGYKKIKDNIIKKFDQERVEKIKDIVLSSLELVNLSDEIKYRRIYIASYVAKSNINKLKNDLKKEGIEFMTLERILKEIIKDIDEWKKRQAERGFSNTKYRTLPENLWLLKLIDYMKTVDFIK